MICLSSLAFLSINTLACGVIEDGTDFDFDVSATFDGLSEEPHDILSFHAVAVEPLGPLDKARLGQTLLLAGETEGEAERQFLSLNLPVMHEVSQALCDMVEESFSTA